MKPPAKLNGSFFGKNVYLSYIKVDYFCALSSPEHHFLSF